MPKRLIPAVILFAYSAILIRVLVFKTMLIRIGHLQFKFGPHTGPANFVPLKSIGPYLLGERGRLFAVVNIVGNIAAFVPIGFLVPLVGRSMGWRRMTWQNALALALAVGLTIEAMEVVFRVGIFDVDDILLNGLGVMIGYWFFTFRDRRRRTSAAVGMANDQAPVTSQ